MELLLGVLVESPSNIPFSRSAAIHGPLPPPRVHCVDAPQYIASIVALPSSFPWSPLAVVEAAHGLYRFPSITMYIASGASPVASPLVALFRYPTFDLSCCRRRCRGRCDHSS